MDGLQRQLDRTSDNEQPKRIRHDIVWVTALSLATYLLALYFDLAERYINWTALGELYQLDEIIFVLLVFCAGLIWFSKRRISELSQALRHNLAMQAELTHNNKKIRQLLNEKQSLVQRITLVRESERDHLASELHDIFGQHLAAMDANLTVALNQTNNSNLTSILESVMDSTTVLRSITRNKLRHLKPPSLDSIGLKGAIRELLSEWRQSFSGTDNISLNVHDDEIPKPIALTLYRALQEGLSNISRHANAENVFIYLHQFREPEHMCIQLRLEDDGQGMDTNIENQSGLGLVSIRERCEALSGEFYISTRQPQGTTLTITLPYDPIV
ncbi:MULTISPECIES: ATP-binding protein [unclassified Methylophaga]|jgi:signal transduction histidine kinase|uniref:sensor histidine kinase n=2 Tax=Methylophaga TaxID=40222 RepID=UPI00259D1B07|nr:MULTISPECIES: ATP-binding protein [unclassified Methylophaga]|tara:strand:+ start:9561 stop:10547 length:987 start_codon:yes stop_codon:yes gene_type:complete